MKKRYLVACLLLVTAVACANPADGRKVASVDGSAAPTATPSLSRKDQLVQYSRCMRDKGVPMSDPQGDGDNVRQGTYEKDSVDKRTVAAADEACKQFRPAVEKSGPDWELKLRILRAFSRCMREHGVTNYPDPDSEGQLISPEFEDAELFNKSRRDCDAQARAGFGAADASPTPSGVRGS